MTTGPVLVHIADDDGNWQPIGWTTTGIEFTYPDMPGRSTPSEAFYPRSMTLVGKLDRQAIPLIRRLIRQIRHQANPRPLSIDGHAYRRRTRRRKS
jgi:hypothetical protein